MLLFKTQSWREKIILRDFFLSRWSMVIGGVYLALTSTFLTFIYIAVSGFFIRLLPILSWWVCVNVNWALDFLLLIIVVKKVLINYLKPCLWLVVHLLLRGKKIFYQKSLNFLNFVDLAHRRAQCVSRAKGLFSIDEFQWFLCKFAVLFFICIS